MLSIWKWSRLWVSIQFIEPQAEAEALPNGKNSVQGAISISRSLGKPPIDWMVSYGNIKPDCGKHSLFLSLEPLQEEEYLVYWKKCISYLQGDRGKIGEAVLIMPCNFPILRENVSQAINRVSFRWPIGRSIGVRRSEFHLINQSSALPGGKRECNPPDIL